MRKLFFFSGYGGRGKTFAASLLADLAIEQGVEGLTLVGSTYNNISDRFKSGQYGETTLSVIKHDPRPGLHGDEVDKVPDFFSVLEKHGIDSDTREHIVIADFGSECTIGLTGKDVMDILKGAAEVFNLELHIMFAMSTPGKDLDACAHVLDNMPESSVTVITRTDIDYAEAQKFFGQHEKKPLIVNMPVAGRPVLDACRTTSLLQLAQSDPDRPTDKLLKALGISGYRMFKPVLADHIR
jgi:hypothetical protein